MSARYAIVRDGETRPVFVGPDVIVIDTPEKEAAFHARAAAADATRAKVRGKSVGSMSMADLRALVHVLAEMNGIEVEP